MNERTPPHGIEIRPAGRFEDVKTMAGFTKAADTDSVINGFHRVLMRLDLRQAA